MKVKELIAILQKHSDDLNVYIAVDPEGNGYNEPYDIGTAPITYDKHYKEINVLHPDDADGTEEKGLIIWP